MSYSSENTLLTNTHVQDVREYVMLLGYVRVGLLKSDEYGNFEEFRWFDEADYRSWTGIELSIYRDESKKIVVSTRTTAGRSYFDLAHQNFTISSMRKRFGGVFVTDEGRGRYLRPVNKPPSAPASGCYMAFSRFGHNLIKASLYHREREFPRHPPRQTLRPLEFIHDMDPRIFANNALVPFLVAAIEDYFKSTFIALLRYSPRKEAFLKNSRLQGEQLVSISDGTATVEDEISESLSFQRISAICRHFDTLDPKLDIGGALRKPYHRRHESLFESLDALVSIRHDFIHRAILDRTMTDERVEILISDLEVAVTRVYRRITEHYGWFFSRSWYLGGKTRKKQADKMVE